METLLALLERAESLVDAAKALHASGKTAEASRILDECEPLVDEIAWRREQARQSESEGAFPMELHVNTLRRQAAMTKDPTAARALNGVADTIEGLDAGTQQLLAQGGRGRPAAGLCPVGEAVGVHERFLDDPRRGFKSPKDLFQAVMRVGMGDVMMPDNLKSLSAGSDEAGTHSDSAGGFLVPESLLAPMAIGSVVDPLRDRVQQVTMETPTVKIPARVDKNHSTSVSGGLRFYRKSQTAAVADSKMELELIELSAHALAALSFATEEVLSDSNGTFMQLLNRSVNEELASTLMAERINGTGVGQMAGILGSAALIVVDADEEQPADTITYTNLASLYGRIWNKPGAVWLHNPGVVPALMTLTNPAGQLIWQPGAVAGSPNTLLGLPMIETEHCPALGEQGDIIGFTPSEYLEGTLRPLSGDESIHVRFDRFERAFRFWIRNDGACWWRSVLTPRNGATLSPIVCLEAR